MLDNLKKILKERPDLLFFGAFLFSIPFTWRKVLVIFLPSRFTGFNEYTDVSIYISDILLIITLLVYIISNKSRFTSILYNRMFHVEHFLYATIIILLAITALISAIFAEQKVLSLYEWLKFMLMYGLFLYVYLQFVPRRTSDSYSTWNFLRYLLLILVISGLFQSIIAFSQVIHGSAIGLPVLRESIVSTDLSGVAKIIFNDHVILRAYGTFLHPNILGGYLFLSIFSLMILKRLDLFHVEQRYYFTMFCILMIGIVATFSKSAIIALIISTIVSSTWNTSQKGKNRLETLLLKINAKFHVEHYIVIGIATIALIIIILLQNSRFLIQSVEERISLYPIAVDMILKSPIVGLGNGHFVYNLPRYSDSIVKDWQLQPIHNIYVLMANESGILYLVLFMILVLSILNSVSRGTSIGKIFVGVLSGYLFIGLLDHYLWDIQAGQLLLWISLALAAGTKYLTSNTNNVEDTFKVT